MYQRESGILKYMPVSHRENIKLLLFIKLSMSQTIRLINILKIQKKSLFYR